MIRLRKPRHSASEGMTQEQLEELLEQLSALKGNVSMLGRKITRTQESLRSAVSGTAAAAPLPRTA